MRGVYTATCTSLGVSGVGEYDGTYEYQSTGYYTRPTGTTAYEIDVFSGYWHLENSPLTTVRQYRVSHGGRCPTDAAFFLVVLVLSDGRPFYV